MTLENMIAKFQYDLKVITKKREKMKSAERDDIDFDELTVSEDEFDDEESAKFSQFLKERRDEI